MFGELVTEAKAAYDSDGNKDFAEVITKFNTDWVWGEPARMTARVFVATGDPAFIYHFSYVPASMQERARYGAGHGSEIPHVFNMLNERWGATEPTTEDKELAKIMSAYWANFAKTGDPNGEGLPVWPLYNTQKEEILDIELDGKTIGRRDPRKARLDVIEKAFRFRNRIQLRGGI